jgi:hypothetical protein
MIRVGHARQAPAGRLVLSFVLTNLCPREESNLDRLVRSEPFYPLNYKGIFNRFVLYYNRSQRINKGGPLAHLVERFHGMEEATGSNPVRSTIALTASPAPNPASISYYMCVIILPTSNY